MQVSPSALRLSSHGQARLRVQGKAHGLVQVARERRWVWGKYDETFVVAVPPQSGAIMVTQTGFGGRSRVAISCSLVTDLIPPAVHTTLPSRRIQVTLPTTRGLTVNRVSAPRIVSFQQAQKMNRSIS